MSPVKLDKEPLNSIHPEYPVSLCVFTVPFLRWINSPAYGILSARMRSLSKLFLVFICSTLFHSAIWAQSYLDTIGVNLLHETATNLDGTGVRVAQPEGWDSATNTWEVNPSNPYVG